MFLAAEASKRDFGGQRCGTQKQIKSLGGQVRKGERGCAILFWQFERTRTVRDERGKPLLDAAGFICAMCSIWRTLPPRRRGRERRAYWC